MKHFFSDFHRQMLEATEILSSDWLRANLSVKITDKMLHEMLPWFKCQERPISISEKN